MGLIVAKLAQCFTYTLAIIWKLKIDALYFIFLRIVNVKLEN